MLFSLSLSHVLGAAACLGFFISCGQNPSEMADMCLVHYFLEAGEDVYEVSPISLLLWFSNSRSGAA